MRNAENCKSIYRRYIRLDERVAAAGKIREFPNGSLKMK
jgi:hypothetical protein